MVAGDGGMVAGCGAGHLVNIGCAFIGDTNHTPKMAKAEEPNFFYFFFVEKNPAKLAASDLPGRFATPISPQRWIRDIPSKLKNGVSETPRGSGGARPN